MRKVALTLFMSSLAKPETPPGFSRPASGVESRQCFGFVATQDISCFNACCRNIDLQLTPYDILRLKNRLGLTSGDFVARYTVPFEMDAHGMQG